MIAVIVPIYNTEKYLRETIDSVICQTLSFAEHIRLILLDDASTDGSFAICEQYQKQYPKQIVVKHYDTNQGAVSYTHLDVYKRQRKTFVLYK